MEKSKDACCQLEQVIATNQTIYIYHGDIVHPTKNDENGNPKKIMENIIVAAITYFLNRDGAYINFIGTLDASYDGSIFGDKKSPNQSFQGMGLATLLIKVIQGLAVQQGYSTNVYLQVNKKEMNAKSFYLSKGFESLNSNDLNCLPESMHQYTKYEIDNYDRSYLSFIPSEI